MYIKYEDKNLLIVLKPPGMPSQADKTGDLDLFTTVYAHLQKDSSKNPYIAMTQRLDRPVGGLMVFSKNKETTRFLENNEMMKYYYCIVCGETEQEAYLTDYLHKNERLNMSQVVEEKTKEAKKAELKYEKLSQTEIGGKPITLLFIELITGRHHQIRVQMAHNKTPLYGDTKYNEEFKRTKEFINIALWAGKIIVKDPKTGKELTFIEKPLMKEPFHLFIDFFQT